MPIIFAGVGPSLWGPNWLRGLTYTFIQQIFGIWLFLNPISGMGIMGLKADTVISQAKHLAFGLVIAWLYPVTAERTTGTEPSAALTAAQRSKS